MRFHCARCLVVLRSGHLHTLEGTLLVNEEMSQLFLSSGLAVARPNVVLLLYT